MIVAVASLHGAPGVTTLAVAVAARMGSPEAPSLLIEADQCGGVLAARHRLQLEPSLVDLASAARRGTVDVREFAQPLGESLRVVPAALGADQVGAALRAATPGLADACAAFDGIVVVDVGRLFPASPALLLVERADLILVVLRPELAEVMGLLQAHAWLPGACRLVLVGESTYSARQIEHVAARCVLATIPGDAEAVRADPFASGRRRRSGWVAAVGDLSVRIQSECDGSKVEVR